MFATAPRIAAISMAKGSTSGRGTASKPISAGPEHSAPAIFRSVSGHRWAPESCTRAGEYGAISPYPYRISGVYGGRRGPHDLHGHATVSKVRATTQASDSLPRRPSPDGRKYPGASLRSQWQGICGPNLQGL